VQKTIFLYKITDVLTSNHAWTQRKANEPAKGTDFEIQKYVYEITILFSYVKISSGDIEDKEVIVFLRVFKS